MLTDFEAELIYGMETWLAAHGLQVGYWTVAAVLLMLPRGLRITAGALGRIR